MRDSEILDFLGVVVEPESHAGGVLPIFGDFDGAGGAALYRHVLEYRPAGVGVFRHNRKFAEGAAQPLVYADSESVGMYRSAEMSARGRR